MIELVQKNQWKKVNVLAVDATYKANINGEYAYRGVGGAFATVTAVKTGWMQQSHELAPSVDFIKHNHFKHALVISQEQSKYQAAASYLWISEEVHN